MNKKITAKKERNKMMISVGNAIYLPKTPEVLIKSTANNSPKNCLNVVCSIKYWQVFQTLF